MTKITIQKVEQCLLWIFLYLCCGFARPAPAQNGPDFPWRNIQSDSLYQVEASDSSVRIIPLGSVQFSADVPIKVDKKGRHHIMGIWQNGGQHGFFLINSISDDVISGYALVPQNSASANSCDSRTAAAIANMAGSSQHVLNCARQDLSWRRETNLTVQQAVSEMQRAAAAAASRPMVIPTAPGVGFVPVGGGGGDGSLAGVWVSEVASAVYYKRIELTLRPDGTYTKTFTARTSGYGGAGTVGAPSLGGTHSGRWTADGLVVHLSGDGNWPPFDHNLAEFQKVQ